MKIVSEFRFTVWVWRFSLTQDLYQRAKLEIKAMYRLFTVCILAPAVFALVRKLLPGQPAALEVGTSLIIVVCFLIARQQARVLPRFITLAAGYWALMQIAYVTPAFIENWRVGLIAIVTRIFPMMMILIAFYAVRSEFDFKQSTRAIGLLAVLLLPIGLVTALWGNNAVPVLFQPTEGIFLANKSTRLGLATVVTIFSNQNVAALNMLAITFVAISTLTLTPLSKRENLFWWVVLASSVLLTFLTTRRGALLGVGVGISAFVLWSSIKHKWQLIGAGVPILAGIAWLDVNSYSLEGFSVSRFDYALDLDFGARISEVFIPFVTYWAIRTPLGSYLGASGPEARVMGIRIWEEYPVEVGAAQLIVEVGVWGAIVFPLILLIIVFNFWRQSRYLRCKNTVRLLSLYIITFFSLYYFKEALAMNSVSLAQVFFWSTIGISASLIESETRPGYAPILDSYHEKF